MGDDVNVLNLINNFSLLSEEEKKLSELYSSSNRINRMGEQLEFFIMDLICNTLDVVEKERKKEIYSDFLSWTGSKNHPPDLIIRGEEAMEVKKTQSKAGGIQLNSSSPHQKLSYDSKRITEECRTCEGEEGWGSKELIYTLGHIEAKRVNFMWIVYGNCWSTEDKVYDKLSSLLSDKIEEAVDELEYGELDTDSNEIGRVNDADPLGRTLLRIRGMWIMDHPANFYAEYIENYKEKIEENNPLFFVVREERFERFPEKDKDRVLNNSNITVNSVEVADPTDGTGRVNVLILEVV